MGTFLKPDVGDPLNNQQLTILRKLAEGKTNDEISKEMFITVDTVKTHLFSMYRKLGVSHAGRGTGRGRHRAVIVGVQMGLIDCPCGSSRERE